MSITCLAKNNYINIAISDDVGKELGRVKNKSRFITQTLREKFIAERKKATVTLLPVTDRGKEIFPLHLGFDF